MPFQIPSFDNVVVSALQQMGVPSLAIWVISTLFALTSWPFVAKLLKYARRVSEDVGNSISQSSPARNVAKVLITIAVLSCQAFTVWICYWAGYVIKEVSISLLSTQEDLSYKVDAIMPVLSMFSITYAVIAFLLIVASYLCGSDGRFFCGLVMAAPAHMVGMYSTFVLVCILLYNFCKSTGCAKDMNVDTNTLPSVGETLTCVISLALFCTMCHLATWSSKKLINAWS